MLHLAASDIPAWVVAKVFFFFFFFAHSFTHHLFFRGCVVSQRIALRICVVESRSRAIKGNTMWEIAIWNEKLSLAVNGGDSVFWVGCRERHENKHENTNKKEIETPK